MKPITEVPKFPTRDAAIVAFNASPANWYQTREGAFVDVGWCFDIAEVFSNGYPVETLIIVRSVGLNSGVATVQKYPWLYEDTPWGKRHDCGNGRHLWVPQGAPDRGERRAQLDENGDD